MVEMTTGQRSFNNYKFDIDLAVMICNGLRPKFAPGTPDCYVELANQCINSDPDKRPNVNEIINKLDEWLYIIESDIENESGIRKQFLENDEISKTLPMITEKLKDIYTSKPYNISEISAKFSKTASVIFLKFACDIEVPNDI
ncbi:hypothetical protein C2G38_2130331 [Gigaspora rosea]|uniref:Serine-threonine/tyrosine-protein kinase catalytic domain-containing protein n=1 Tax=Gigaspora rosea TaxID=44941 RepID=A0A397TTD5_9GLOM|nr:hypothetical protein C2G38_2130331 [Gigaspora rosea]